MLHDQFQLQRPIFVGGAGSSGSSLLARMLDRHSQVYCGPEASLFNKSVLFEDFARLQNQLPHWLANGIPTDGYFGYPRILPHGDRDVLSAELLIEWANESTTLREFVDRLQIHCLQASNKRRYAEKTPSNTYCFSNLAKLYPECSLVHPVRDGRDVVCSLLRRGFNVFQAASMWLYNTAAALACEHSPQYYRYSYESLAREPEKTLAGICDHLGIPLEPTMLAPDANDRRRAALADVWKSSPGAPVSTRSIGRYREEMGQSTYVLFSSIRLTTHAAKKLGVETWSTLDVLRRLGYVEESSVVSKRAIIGHMMAARDYCRTNIQRLRHGARLQAPLTRFSFS